MYVINSASQIEYIGWYINFMYSEFEVKESADELGYNFMKWTE
jgi:hypothetical protein